MLYCLMSFILQYFRNIFSVLLCCNTNTQLRSCVNKTREKGDVAHRNWGAITVTAGKEPLKTVKLNWSWSIKKGAAKPKKEQGADKAVGGG